MRVVMAPTPGAIPAQGTHSTISALAGYPCLGAAGCVPPHLVIVIPHLVIVIPHLVIVMSLCATAAPKD